MIGLMRSFLSIAMLVAAFAVQTISVSAAACPGEVSYKYNKAQNLSTPVGWTMFQDLDGDGKKDLIGINKSTTTAPTPATLVFYKRTIGGYVTAPVVSSLGSSFTTYGMIVGDINGDGSLDLLNIDTNAAPFTMTAYFGNGGGGFTAGPTSTIGYTGTFAIGDLNGDGKGDLVGGTSNGAGYHLAQADGSFGALVSLSSTSTVDVRVADFNIDGKMDVLLWNLTVPKTLYNQGGGTFTSVEITSGMTFRPVPELIADVNADGRPDIISGAHRNSGSTQNSAFTVFLAQADGSFNAAQYAPGVIPYTLAGSRTAVADVDGDGDLDVLIFWVNVYSIAYNNGAGSMIGGPTINTSLQPGFYDDAVGDAAADAISLNRPGIFNELSDSVRFSQSVCGRAGRTDFIDFDGDGNTDIGFFRPSDGLWSNRNSRDGGTFFPYTNISGFGAAGDIPASQDFNGDGVTERAFFRPSTGTWAIRDAAGVLSTVQWGATGDKPVPSDYDGDGKADVAVYRPSNGTWWVLYSSNGGYSVQSFGTSEDIPVPMDYDGDRLTDIAVFRPSTGVWYIQKSTGGYWINAFGISTDKPIPGDFDNDGSADIAVFRDGQWYVQRIRDGAVAIRLWGQAGDVPVPFNHVGNNWGANFAVYRGSINWVFELDELSQIMNQMGTNKTTSTILPSN